VSGGGGGGGAISLDRAVHARATERGAASISGSIKRSRGG
jgi:hypothetical protein